MAKEVTKVRPPERGGAITARYLQNTTRRIEQLERGGGAPKSKQPKESAPESTTVINNTGTDPTNEVWVETGRTTTTVRIENPSDPNQFVDVERATTVTFLRPDDTTVVLILSSS